MIPFLSHRVPLQSRLTPFGAATCQCAGEVEHNLPVCRRGWPKLKTEKKGAEKGDPCPAVRALPACNPLPLPLTTKMAGFKPRGAGRAPPPGGFKRHRAQCCTGIALPAVLDRLSSAHCGKQNLDFPRPGLPRLPPDGPVFLVAFQVFVDIFKILWLVSPGLASWQNAKKLAFWQRKGGRALLPLVRPHTESSRPAFVSFNPCSSLDPPDCASNVDPSPYSHQSLARWPVRLASRTGASKT